MSNAHNISVKFLNPCVSFCFSLYQFMIWFYLLWHNINKVGSYKRNTWHNLSDITNLLPFEHQQKNKTKKICFVIFTNLANSSWDLWQIGIITYGSGWKKGVENQHLEFGTWELTSGCSIHNNQNALTPVRQTRWWSTTVQAVKYTLQVLSLVSAFAAVRNYRGSSPVWTAWP